MLNKALLNKRIVPIIEELINSFYETDEEDKKALCDDALESLEEFLEEFDSEKDWKEIIDFANNYIDHESNNHDIDILPIKQIIAEQVKW